MWSPSMRAGAMGEVEFVGQDVIIHIPKGIVVLTVTQLKEALKRGKAYRRRQQRTQRLLKAAQEGYGTPH